MAVLHFDEKSFEREVLQAQTPVLVDFWADWCGPCQALGPVLEELAAEQTGVKVGKVNVDEQRNLALKYRIMSIPTLILFKNGAAVGKAIGMQSKRDLEQLLRR